LSVKQIETGPRPRLVAATAQMTGCDQPIQCRYFQKHVLVAWCIVFTASDLSSTGREFDSRPYTAGLLPRWVTVCVGGYKPSRYVTGHLGQLSLASLRGRYIEYRPCHLSVSDCNWLELVTFHHHLVNSPSPYRPNALNYLLHVDPCPADVHEATIHIQHTK